MGMTGQQAIDLAKRQRQAQVQPNTALNPNASIPGTPITPGLPPAQSSLPSTTTVQAPATGIPGASSANRGTSPTANASKPAPIPGDPFPNAPPSNPIPLPPYAPDPGGPKAPPIPGDPLPGEKAAADPQFAQWSQTVNTSRYDPALVKQFYDIFSAGSGGQRLPRQDEIDQWLGGYLAKDDINGQGQTIPKWTPGSQIDPYWAWRITGHAQGDYNGDNPGYLGEGDQNSNRAAQGGSSATADALAAAAATQNVSASYGGSSSAYQAPAAPSSEMDALVQKRITELLNTPQTVDQAALDASPQMAAVRQSEQRTQERDRAQIAERRTAQGLPTSSGGFDTDLAALSQRRGENESQAAGSMATQQLQDNRAQLLAGLQMALQSGQFDKAQQLQERLATLDASLRTASLNESGRQSDASRQLQRELGLLGIGYNYDALQAQQNQAATLAALGL